MDSRDRQAWGLAYSLLLPLCCVPLGRLPNLLDCSLRLYLVLVLGQPISLGFS